MRQEQISSYERGVNVPSGEILIELAEVFGVTVDYLVARRKSPISSARAT